METLAAQRSTINLRDTRELVKDLLGVRPGVYWADMLASAAIGWIAFGLSVAEDPWSVRHVVLSLIAALGLYRGAMFIHELTHLPKGALPGFQWAWDLALGIPLQLPSFMYLGVHLDHHRRTVYGTEADPEYLPLASGPRRRIVVFLAQALVIPILLLARFALLAPLSVLLGPRVRRIVVERASSLAINWRYRRDPPSEALRARWLVCESLAAFASMSLISLTIAGYLPASILGQWLLVSTSVAVVNQLRTLGAHRWRNDGAEMDVVSQFLDSVNTPGAVAALWAPVGLRFHALHHFVPDLPYHALAAAHRRLASRLPAESGYARTISTGLAQSVRTVWSEARTTRDARASETATG
jgi:fatty acid desaturase